MEEISVADLSALFAHAGNVMKENEAYLCKMDAQSILSWWKVLNVLWCRFAMRMVYWHQ